MTTPSTSLNEQRHKLSALIASVEMFLFEEQRTESNLGPTRMSAWKIAVSNSFLGINANQTPREYWTRLH